MHFPVISGNIPAVICGSFGDNEDFAGEIAMKRLLPCLFVSGLFVNGLFPALSLAHGPTPQKADQRITIDAPVSVVWEQVKQFDKIADWHPDVKHSLGDGKLASGGTRTLTLAGGELVEELDFYSDSGHEYSYRLKTENVKALPVSSHSTSLQVAPGASANQTVVMFKSRFYRGDTGNTPPENLNDAAAVTAMKAFFNNGLQGLKQKLESPVR